MKLMSIDCPLVAKLSRSVLLESKMFLRWLFNKLFLLAFFGVCMVLTSTPEVALQTIHLDLSNYSISLRVKVCINPWAQRPTQTSAEYK